MNELKSSLKDFEHLRFVVDELSLSSAAGRRFLYDTPWTCDKTLIESRLLEVEKVVVQWQNGDVKKSLEYVAALLCDLHIVVGSIETLASGATCSDIDFFELKAVAMLARKVKQIIDDNQLQLMQIPVMEDIINLLDPDNTGISAFFLSNSYSAELASLRKQQENAVTDDELTRIAEATAAEEEKVRKQLSKQLKPFTDKLRMAYNAMSAIDVLIAKAKWAVAYNACKPIPIMEGSSELENLMNPAVEANLKKRNDHFQPVSISFPSSPVLITGANMAGKSVLLSSIALAQMLMQYGFYVPASTARLVIVEEVMTSFSDGQDMNNGLSSYAAEILTLDNMLKVAKEGKKVLLLIDEAARTTNPEEGRGLVEALVLLFSKYQARAIITTHYSGIKAEVMRYRVKGFIEERVQKPLNLNSLNKCIDYQLIEDSSNESPKEALRIAEILGVDNELLSFSKHCIEEHKQNI